jgi:septum formation protein
VLILASVSPRRRDLLAEHEYAFRVVPAEIEERAPAHLTPGEIVLFNARAKSAAVAAQYPEDVVLGVDTLVAFEGRVYGKPADMNEALAMAGRLNGRTHEVFSGVWLMRASTGEQRGFIEMTRVHFRRLARPRLRRYLERIEPLDKAGAYAAQNDNGELIESFEGSFTNVIGLPMERLAPLLDEFGLGKKIGA